MIRAIYSRGGPVASPGRWRDDRGQTLQDFTVGILVFVLTVSLVLATIVGYVSPYWSGVGSDEVAQSERIAEGIVADFAGGSDPTELDPGRLESQVFSATESALRSRWGLASSTNLRVSVTPVDGSNPVVHAGTKFVVGGGSDGQETARQTRIVTLGTGACDPACHLVVEVW